MDPNEMEGLEFELETDIPSADHSMQTEAKPFIRKSFRVPIDENCPMYAQVAGREYRVINLSEGGVGFLIDQHERFLRDDRIEALTLKMRQRVLTFKGRVAHISPHETGDCLCGVEFVEMDAQTARELGEILAENQRYWFEAR
jgi:c-di-GMP-binding flagellar brake protein YcgR